jgi:hypothetical protein
MHLQRASATTFPLEPLDVITQLSAPELLAWASFVFREKPRRSLQVLLPRALGVSFARQILTHLIDESVHRGLLRRALAGNAENKATTNQSRAQDLALSVFHPAAQRLRSTYIDIDIDFDIDLDLDLDLDIDLDIDFGPRPDGLG